MTKRRYGKPHLRYFDCLFLFRFGRFHGFFGQRADILRLDLFRKRQRQHHCHNEHACDRVVRKNIAHQLRHTGEEFRDLRHADADGEGGRGDDGVALVKAALAEHRDARDDDRAEHDDRAAAQHAVGQRGEERAHRREQAREDQRQRAKHDREPVDDLRHGDKTDVLAEGRDGRAAEHAAGHGGDKAVAGKRAGDLFFRDVPAETAGADRGGIADGLRRGDEEHERHGDDRAEIELRREGEELRQRDDPELGDRLLHGREVDHAEEQGYDIAHDQAEQHVQLLPEALGKRIVNEARTGTAQYGGAAIGANKGIIDTENDCEGFIQYSTDYTVPADTDGDGIPDEWEKKHGLNPNVADQNLINGLGYTALEVYLNSLMGEELSDDFHTNSISNVKSVSAIRYDRQSNNLFVSDNAIGAVLKVYSTEGKLLSTRSIASVKTSLSDVKQNVFIIRLEGSNITPRVLKLCK